MRATALTLAAILVACPIAGTALGISYRVTDLGLLPGFTASYVSGINDYGTVVGWETAADGTTHGFLYNATGMVDIAPPPGATDSITYAINSAGTFVGENLNADAYAGPGMSYATLSGADLNKLGPPDWQLAQASAINDSGMVAGWGWWNLLPRAFLYDNGRVIDLGTLPGATFNAESFASDINNSGQVAGVAYLSTSQLYWHAFLYSGGTMHDLGTLPGDTNSLANSINDLGQIAGYSATLTPIYVQPHVHAFLYDNGIKALGTLYPNDTDSIAFGINNSGRVVGDSGKLVNDAIVGNPFLNRGSAPNGTMIDLNQCLVNPPAGTAITSADTINNRQQIIANGTTPDGATHALLLTPVPPNFKQGGAGTTWGGLTTLHSDIENPAILPGQLLPSSSNVYAGDLGGYPMSATGCFVTSAAMILNSFDHNIDPGKLDTTLRNLTAATPTGYWYGKGNLFPNGLGFPQLTSYGQTDGVAGPPVRFFDQTIPTPGGRAGIISYLQVLIDKYGPVIVTVPSASATHGGVGASRYPFAVHAVVAYDVENGDVLIRDPGWHHDSTNGDNDANNTFSLDDYVDFVNSRVPPVNQIPTQNGLSDYSWMAFKPVVRVPQVVTSSSQPLGYGSANCPIELVITDREGRRLGYDPIHSVSYNEIPGSAYERTGFIASTDDTDNSQPTGYSPIEFQIGDLVRGKYSVQVYGLDSGPWSIDLGVSDPAHQLAFSTQTFSGSASLGSDQQFSVNLNSIPIPPAPTLWASAVSGNWSDSSKWTGGVPNAVGAVAAISASTTAALSITLDGPMTVGGLQFGNSGNPSVGYALRGSDSNTLTFNNWGNGATITVTGGSHVINAPVILADNLVVTSGSTNPWTLSFGTGGSISESGGGSYSLTMSGSGGTLILSGSNSYTGGTIVTAGTLSLGASLALIGRLDVEQVSTLNMAAHPLTADTVQLGWNSSQPVNLLNRGQFTATNLQVYAAAQTFDLNPSDTVTNFYLSNGSSSVNSPVSHLVISSNSQATLDSPVSALTLSSTSQATTTASGFVTASVSVDDYSTLNLGASMTLSGFLDAERNATLNMAGYPVSAGAVYLGWYDSQTVAVLNRGAITATNLYVAGQSFDLSASDSVTNFYLSNGTSTLHAPVSSLNLSNSALATMTATSNGTGDVSVDLGSTLTLGSSMTLGGNLDVERNSTLDMAGRPLTADTIGLGTGYGQPVAVVNRGPITANSLQVYAAQTFNLNPSDAVTNFYLSYGTCTLYSPVSYLSLSSSARATTTASGNVTGDVSVDLGSTLTLGASMALSGNLDVDGNSTLALDPVRWTVCG